MATPRKLYKTPRNKSRSTGRPRGYGKMPKRPLKAQRRAQNITSMAMPSTGALGRILRDALRREPDISRGAAAAAGDSFHRAVGQANGIMVAGGGRRLDMPGLRHAPRRVGSPRKKTSTRRKY